MGIFKKIESFFKTHVETGLLHMEYRKHECKRLSGHFCDYCNHPPLNVFHDLVTPVP